MIPINTLQSCYITQEDSTVKIGNSHLFVIQSPISFQVLCHDLKGKIESSYHPSPKVKGIQILVLFTAGVHFRAGSKEIYFQHYGRYDIDKIWRDDVLPCRVYLRHW